MNLNQIYENKILIGIATITATIILLGWISINENARMEEFTERAEGRAIENGARLFEANCAPCHGFEGLGTERAPALNNPHLFGYDFRGDIPAQIVALTAQIERATDAEERARLEAEKAALEAEATVIEETVVYDWSEMVEPADVAVCAETPGEPNPVTGVSERQECELGQLGVELMLFDQRLSQRLEGVYEDQFLLDLLPRYSDTLEPLFERRAELLAVEERTPEQQAELTGVRSEIGAILAENLSTLVGDMETQFTVPLLNEQTDLKGRQDAGETLTAEQEARLAELETLLDEQNAIIDPLRTILKERDAIAIRQGRFNALRDAHEEVKRLREELAAAEGELAALEPAPEDGSPDPLAVEREALTTTATEAQAALDAAITARDTAFTALVDAGDIVDYRFIFDDDATPNHSRLPQVGWSGTLYDFVEGTLVGGRPPSKSYWNEPMAAWSQRSGGPLRDDQIQNLVRYILNWDREFTVEDLRAVNQFAKVPGEGGQQVDTIGNDPLIASETVNALIGGGLEPDAALGERVFQDMGCAACHVAAGGGPGPSMDGFYNRVTDNVDDRLTATGTESQPDMYIFHSVLQPQEFIVPGFEIVAMPAGFGDRIAAEDFVHLIEYLKEQ